MSIDDTKKRLQEMDMEKNAIPYEWTSSPSGDISDISKLSLSKHKPVKTQINNKKILFRADSSPLDAHLDCFEQLLDLKEISEEKLIKLWRGVCNAQFGQTVNDEDFHMTGVAVSKALFSRFPQHRDKIDLPQTFELYKAMLWSNNPENNALVKDVKKDLQTKAWLYYGRPKSQDSEKLIRPTPYSCSCISDLMDYVQEDMNAPCEIIEPRLDDIEISVLNAVNEDSIGTTMSEDAATYVYGAAIKHPKHERSQEIREKIKKAPFYNFGLSKEMD